MKIPIPLLQKFFTTVALISLVCANSYSQKVEIEWTEIAKDKIIVHYIIDDINPMHEYQVSLFASHDSFSAPLVKVSGDVGPEVKPGKNKTIVWYIKQELGNYKGQIELELTARIFVPFLKLANRTIAKKYKRGKSYPLVWTSGNLSGHIDIELYKGTTRISSDRNVPNTGKFEWLVHAHIKPAKNYTLKFTNTKNRDEVITSENFAIKPKIPWTVKVGVLTIIGTGAVLLIQQLAEGSGNSNNDLVDITSVGVPKSTN